MKMFIPTLGNMIRLTKDWEFRLFAEHRNSDLRQAMDVAMPEWKRDAPNPSAPVTLPKGTVLKVDRIYIKGVDRAYDSITFRTVASPDARLSSKKMGGSGKSCRFWAKLNDVNRIEYEAVDELA